MTDQQRIRRLAVAPLAALAAVAVALLGASPAHAVTFVTGGCSVQTAPAIQSGQPQTSDPNHCPDHREYWAIDLAIGDQLNVDLTPAPPSVFVEPYQLGVYGPNVGTIGSFLCQNVGSGPSRVNCVIPAGGRYILVSYGAGAFTATMKTARSQKGRVAGSCDPVNAPAATDRVTQYSNGMVCRPSGAIQHWAMTLHRGDVLRVDSLAIPSTGNAEPFDLQVYGPSPSSLGRHVCGNSGLGPAFGFRCPIRATGRYVLAASNSGSFTPLVTHPTRTHIGRPRLVGDAIVLRATIQSDVPHPAGTCLFQERSGRRWISVARTHTTAGACKSRVGAKHPGTLHLRAKFHGAKGWASSASKPVVVNVR